MYIHIHTYVYMYINIYNITNLIDKDRQWLISIC